MNYIAVCSVENEIENAKQINNEIETTNKRQMVVKHAADDAAHNNERWPVHNTKIILHRIGRLHKRKRYQIVGIYPQDIYSDYYYSPELLFQRANPTMFEDPDDL